MKAFVSFIRHYKEHQCNYIFNFKELDIGKLAESFCLIKVIFFFHFIFFFKKKENN